MSKPYDTFFDYFININTYWWLTVLRFLIRWFNSSAIFYREHMWEIKPEHSILTRLFFFFFCLPIFKVFGLDVESKFQISCPPVSMVLLKMLRLLFNTECLIKQGLMHYLLLLLKHFRHNSVLVLRRVTPLLLLFLCRQFVF